MIMQQQQQSLSLFKIFNVALLAMIIICTMNIYYRLAMTKNGHTNENKFDSPNKSTSSTHNGITKSHHHYLDDSRIMLFDESNTTNQINQDNRSDNNNNNNNNTTVAFMEYRGQRRSHSYFDPNQIVRSQSQSQLLHDVDSDSSSSKNDNNTEYVEFTRYDKKSNEKIETWKAKKRSYNECVTDELQKWKKEYEYTMDNNTNTSMNALSTSTFGISQLQQPTPYPLFIGWRQPKGTLDPTMLVLEAEDMRRNSRTRERRVNTGNDKIVGGRGRHGRCLKQYFDYYSKLQKPFSGEYDFFNWLDYGSGRSIQLNKENESEHHKRKRLQKLKMMNNSSNITDTGIITGSYCTRVSIYIYIYIHIMFSGASCRNGILFLSSLLVYFLFSHSICLFCCIFYNIYTYTYLSIYIIGIFG